MLCVAVSRSVALAVLPVVCLLCTCLRVARNVLLALRSRTRLVQLSSLRIRP